MSLNVANMTGIRKKFRKMKVRFDFAMRQSNDIYILERKGIETARRIAIENELA
jgi:hypothetical protein